jgi:heptosyltransferase-2
LATVAVIRFGAVGDVVLTTGALSTLAAAWPTARLVYVTKAASAPLIEHHPAVAAVVALGPGDGTLALYRQLAALRPDAVLDLHDKLRSALLRRVVPATRRVVWEKRDRWDGLRVRLRLRRYLPNQRIAARYHRAVERLVGATLPESPMRLHLDDATRARGRQLLAAAGVAGAGPVVGMAPGAMWETKRWPEASWAALARACGDAGHQVLLTGSAAEAELCARIVAAAPGSIDLSGRLSLAELLGIVDACTAFVANDSGPMHIARALGVPTVAFFGSTAPAQFDFTGHALQWAAVACAPCSLYGLRRCPEGHLRCMTELGVEGAFAALAALVARGGRRWGVG